MNEIDEPNQAERQTYWYYWKAVVELYTMRHLSLTATAIAIALSLCANFFSILSNCLPKKNSFKLNHLR